MLLYTPVEKNQGIKKIPKYINTKEIAEETSTHYCVYYSITESIE